MRNRSRKVIVSAGLYSSASTWAFNLIRGLVARSSPRPRVISEYFELDVPAAWLAAQRRNGATAIIKTHKPGDVALGLAFAGAPVVLTLRDPHDAVASLMVRFFYEFEAALDAVATSGDRILRLRSVCRPFELRYEDSFVTAAATIRRVADFVGLDVTAATERRLRESLSIEKVRALVDRAFPPDRARGDPNRLFDPVRHWHVRHIGDTRVGKFHDVLSRSQIRIVRRRAARLIGELGYAS
jgi:hypothetical protein